MSAKSLSLIVLTFSICFSSGIFAKEHSSKPLAQYGNRIIKEEELSKFYKESNITSAFNGKQLEDLPKSMKKSILEIYLKRLILEDAAKESKIEKTEEYKKDFQTQARAFLIGSFLQKKIDERLTDDAIESSYRDMVKNLKEKGEIRLQYLFFASNADAKEALAKIKSSKSFAEAYKDFPKENKSAKSLSGRYLGPWDISPEILVEKAYELAPMQYSDVINTEHGFYIVQVLEKRAVKQLPSFAEAKYQIKERLANQYREELEENLTKQAKIKFLD